MGASPSWAEYSLRQENYYKITEARESFSVMGIEQIIRRVAGSSDQTIAAAEKSLGG